MGDRREDRFGKMAREDGFEARSVYKLEEIQKKHRLISGGMRVVDLGCHPGSWSRYALDLIGERGWLVGVDTKTPPGLRGVFLTESVFDVTPERLLEALGGPADVVLSDMAPSTTGDRAGDHYRQIELARQALTIALAVVRPGGSFVCKVFEGGEAAAFVNEARAGFGTVRRVRPEAVRKESREWFLVGTARRNG